jgi:NitT/TauT family transport system permease protein
MQTTADTHTREIAGLDALELAGDPGPGRARRLWSSTWPKLGAIALVLLIWQVTVWSGWKSQFVLPPPGKAWAELLELFDRGVVTEAIGRTMQRAAIGYGLALVIGIVVGSLVARIKVLRAAVGSMITGIQTMPSIAWFPLAIVFFGLSEGAIRFVVVLGAAPAIANGIIAGADNIPPILLRAGRVLGARGLSAYRHIVLPASMPSFVGGMKQGWAFAWRSLMAGELLGVVKGQSIGTLLENQRNLANYPGVYAVMMVILVIGIAVDALFGMADRSIRGRWGLIDAATS